MRIEKGGHCIDYSEGGLAVKVVKISNDMSTDDVEYLLDNIAEDGLRGLDDYSDSENTTAIETTLRFKKIVANTALPIKYEKTLWTHRHGCSHDEVGILHKAYYSVEHKSILLYCMKNNPTEESDKITHTYIEFDISEFDSMVEHNSFHFELGEGNSSGIDFFSLLDFVRDRAQYYDLTIDDIIEEAQTTIDPSNITLALLPKKFPESINREGVVRTYSHLAGTLVTCCGEEGGKIVVYSENKPECTFVINKDLLLPLISLTEDYEFDLESYTYDRVVRIRRDERVLSDARKYFDNQFTRKMTSVFGLFSVHTYNNYDNFENTRTRAFYRRKEIKKPIYTDSSVIDQLDSFNIACLGDELRMLPEAFMEMRSSIQAVFNAIGYKQPLTVKNMKDGIEIAVREAEEYVKAERERVKKYSEELFNKLDFNKIKASSVTNDISILISEIQHIESSIARLESNIIDATRNIEECRKSLIEKSQRRAELDGLIPAKDATDTIKEALMKIFGTFEVLKYDVEDNEVCLLINSITMVHPDSKITYDTGDMILKIDFSQRDARYIVRVYPARNYIIRDSKFHPHVSSSNIVCMGEGLPIVSSALQKGDYYTVVRVVLGILSTYNPASPYIRLDTLKACRDSGDIIQESELYKRLIQERNDEINNRR